MSHFAANYIFDGYKLIKNAFISVNNLGEITYVSSENEALNEKARMEFHNGIIAPGFINAHCHLELSASNLKYITPPGLSKFVEDIIKDRSDTVDEKKIALADRKMFHNGISAVGDIVNTTHSIPVKQKSDIFYKNFIEISGLIPKFAEKRYIDGQNLLEEFKRSGLNANLNLHSFYSISSDLFNLTKARETTDVMSIHFLESKEETSLYFNKNGKLLELLKSIRNDYTPLCEDYYCFADLLTQLKAEKILLVHNTQIKTKDVLKNNNLIFCLCPNSNLNLHGELPFDKFIESVKLDFVVGTDSLASNHKLCVLSELKTLEKHFPFLKINELLSAGTINGARALNIFKQFGSLEIGKKPGLILIENSDLKCNRLGSDAEVKRLL